MLPGPEAAARAAAAAPAKKRNEAEATIADAVSKALHILGSLKQIVSLIAGCYTVLPPGWCWLMLQSQHYHRPDRLCLPPGLHKLCNYTEFLLSWDNPVALSMKQGYATVHGCLSLLATPLTPMLAAFITTVSVVCQHKGPYSQARPPELLSQISLEVSAPPHWLRNCVAFCQHMHTATKCLESDASFCHLFTGDRYPYSHGCLILRHALLQAVLWVL